MMQRRVALAVLWYLGPLASRALANHAACEQISRQGDYGGSAVELSIGARSAGFSLGDRSGSWYELSPAIGVAPWDWLYLSGRFGMAHVAYDGRLAETGITDTETAARVRLFENSVGTWGLWTGLGASLPTGSAEKGIGMGHVMLAPQVELFFRPSERLRLGMRVADVQVLGNHNGHIASTTVGAAHAGHVHGETGIASGAMGSVLMPHALHEVLLSGFMGWAWTRVQVQGVLSSQLVATRDAATGLGHGLSAIGAVTISMHRSLDLGLGVGAPLAGDARFRWLGQANLSWRIETF